MKVTFWSNVAVTKDLAKLCLHDHWELGQTQDEMFPGSKDRKMVSKVRKWRGL
jgi:hypothetical protein